MRPDPRPGRQPASLLAAGPTDPALNSFLGHALWEGAGLLAAAGPRDSGRASRTERAYLAVK